MREERRSSHPYAGAIAALVERYNELRERKTPAQRRVELVGECLNIMRDKLEGLLLRHDASRVVGCCAKFGNAQQREEICRALAGRYLALAKDKHGHFIVEKLLRYGSKDAREAVRRELRGHVARLATHVLGALVLEVGFQHSWNAAQSWDLYQELFGAKFAAFKVGDDVTGRSMGALLEAHPQQRRAVLESAFYTIAKQADKGLLSLHVAQRLLGDYVAHAPPEQIVALIPLLRDHFLAILASREGAAAAAACLSYGTPKERKLLLRALKGHMLDVACHDHGHMVLIVALAVTDDTRASGSAVWDELSPHIPYLACHRFGRKTLLSLLVPRSSTYFTPGDLALLAPAELPAYLVSRKEAAPPPVPAAAPAGDAQAAGSIVAAADGTARPFVSTHVLAAPPPPAIAADAAAMALVRTSKKPDALRAAELLAQVRDALESAIQTHTSVLARSSYGAGVLVEASLALGRGMAPAVQPSLAALEAVADLLVEEPDAATLGAQIDAMNASARAASFAAQSATSKLERSAATAAVGPAAAIVTAAVGAKRLRDDGSDNGVSASATGSAAVKRAHTSVVADAEDSAVAQEEEDEEEEEEDNEESGDEDEDDEEDDEEEVNDDDVSDADTDQLADIPYAEAANAVRLPILEDPESHYVFKRLLAREAVPAVKKHAESAAAVAKRSAAEADGPVIFGPLVWQRIQGRVLSYATSNRACFVLAELTRSRDAAIARAVIAELRGAQKQLALLPPSAGRDVLLKCCTT